VCALALEPEVLDLALEEVEVLEPDVFELILLREHILGIVHLLCPTLIFDLWFYSQVEFLKKDVKMIFLLYVSRTNIGCVESCRTIH